MRKKDNPTKSGVLLHLALVSDIVSMQNKHKVWDPEATYWTLATNYNLANIRILETLRKQI